MTYHIYWTSTDAHVKHELEFSHTWGRKCYDVSNVTYISTLNIRVKVTQHVSAKTCILNALDIQVKMWYHSHLDDFSRFNGSIHIIVSSPVNHNNCSITRFNFLEEARVREMFMCQMWVKVSHWKQEWKLSNTQKWYDSYT